VTRASAAGSTLFGVAASAHAMSVIGLANHPPRHRGAHIQTLRAGTHLPGRAHPEIGLKTSAPTARALPPCHP